MTLTAREEEIVQRAERIINSITKPMFVFRMARACQDRPGAETRLVNAASQILRELDRDY